MPVTGIQNVRNTTDDNYLFVNTEFSGNNAELWAGQVASVNNCWVPWCDSEADFPAHHIEITNMTTGQVTWYIWQHKDSDGDFVRFSTDGFVLPGIPMDGDPGVGQSKNLAVDSGAIILDNA